MIRMVMVHIYMRGQRINLLDFSLQDLDELERAIESHFNDGERLYKCCLGNACEDGTYGRILCFLDKVATDFSSDWCEKYLRKKITVKPDIDVILYPMSGMEYIYD